MKKTKRLFLFAGFDKDKIIDDTVVYYINALSKLGDIVFVADNDLDAKEIKKISKIPNVLYVGAGRHGEYDFGSYKRAYLWAKNQGILKKYDWMYLVNDSVYGPLNNLEPLVLKLETSGAGLIGMSSNCDNYTPLHVQSWFVGFTKEIFISSYFDEFMQKIKHISKKMYLVLRYEVSLTTMILRHGFSMNVILDAKNNNLYGNPRQCLIKGVPFIKKAAASKIGDLYFLYPHLDDDVLMDYIVAHMQRHNIEMVKSAYYTCYDLRLFGIPLIQRKTKESKYHKIYLFGFIPLFKIIK